MACATHGIIQIYRRKHEDAIVHIERALELDPLNPYGSLARNLYYLTSGELDKALAHCQESYRRFPTATLGFILSSAHLKADQPREAIKVIEKMISEHPWQPNFSSFLGFCHVCVGELENAEAVLHDLNSKVERHSIEEFHMGLIEFALGRFDVAYPRFEAAYRDRTFVFLWCKLVGLYDCAPIVPNDRFMRLLARLNLG